MSNYCKWFDNSGYEPGYGGSGKRKRDDFSLGSGGYTSSYGSSTSYSTSSGSRPSSSKWSGASEYDNFLASQQIQMNDVSKKLRKMEMMKQIAELEQEDDPEEVMLRQKLERLKQKKMRDMQEMDRGGFNYGVSNYYNNDYYGHSSGYSGRPSLLDLPMGRRQGGYARNFGDYNRGMSYGSMNQQRYGGGGSNQYGRRGQRMGRSGGDRNGSGGGANQRSGEIRNRNGGRRSGRPVTVGPKDPIDIEGRDDRLKQLMEKMNAFKDRTDESTTLYACIRIHELKIDIFYFQKSAALYLDGIYFGRGLEKPYKQEAFKEAIHKLRNLTLEQIKEEAEAMGKLAELPPERDNPRPPSEDINSLVCPLIYSELPFVERFQMLAEELKKYEHITVCLKIYCTKYNINLISVYHHLADEEINKHEYRIYANELFLTSAQGRLRRRVEFEALKNVQELCRTKTVEEIMENDGRFSKDYEEFPHYTTYRGVGDQVESNAFQLRFFKRVHDLSSLKDRNPNDLIIMEKNIWKAAFFKILEESSTYCLMVLKWHWNVEHPGDGPTGEAPKNKISVRKKNEVFAFDEKLKECREQARREKCNVIRCKLTLQDVEISEGCGTTRNQATRMAASSGYRSLIATQTAIFHTDEDKTFLQKEYMWPELRKRAEELQETQPEPPVFEDMRNLEAFSEEFSMDHPDDTVEDDTEQTEDDSKMNNGNTKISETEKDDDLEPWVKEVVRKDMEDLSEMDILVEGGLMYHNMPRYVRDVVAHYCVQYHVNHKSKFENRKLIGISVNKQTPDIYHLVNKLMEVDDKKAYGYMLEQVRKEDGTLQSFHKHTSVKGRVRRRFFHN